MAEEQWLFPILSYCLMVSIAATGGSETHQIDGEISSIRLRRNGGKFMPFYMGIISSRVFQRRGYAVICMFIDCIQEYKIHHIQHIM